MTFSGTSRRRALKLGLAASLAAPAVVRAQAWPGGPDRLPQSIPGPRRHRHLLPAPGAGNVDMMFDAMGTSATQIRSGKLRGLAVATPQRMAEFPDIPTSAEIGVSHWIVSTWYGLWAIKGTPQPIVERMYLEVAKALRVDRMQEIWKDKAAEAGGETPEQFAQRIRSEIDKWQKVVAAADVRIN